MCRRFGGSCCLRLHWRLRSRVSSKPWYLSASLRRGITHETVIPNICSPENHGSQNWAWYRMGRKWLDRDDRSTWANRFSRFVLDFHLNSSSPWLCSGQSVIQMEIGWSKRNIAVEICIHLHRRHWWMQLRVVCQHAVIPPSEGHSVSRDYDNVKMKCFQ